MIGSINGSPLSSYFTRLVEVRLPTRPHRNFVYGFVNEGKQEEVQNEGSLHSVFYVRNAFSKFLNVHVFEARGSSKTNNFENVPAFKDPLVFEGVLYSFIFEVHATKSEMRSATRTSMRRVKYERRGLPFMLQIMAPVGVEAASHVFAALAIGAAPPVTGKRQRCT